MKKVLIKTLMILLAITIMSITNFNTEIYATSLDDIISQGDTFISKADDKTEVIDEEEVKNTSKNMYNILFTIGVVLSVAIGMIIGIQFIMGSVEEKAKVKETLVPYVVGVFVIFAAFTIWKIVVSIGNEVAPTASIQTVEDKHVYKV